MTTERGELRELYVAGHANGNGAHRGRRQLIAADSAFVSIQSPAIGEAAAGGEMDGPVALPGCTTGALACVAPLRC